MEVSTRDAFWGAKPRGDGGYEGANVLGRLWTWLRDGVADGELGTGVIEVVLLGGE